MALSAYGTFEILRAKRDKLLGGPVSLPAPLSFQEISGIIKWRTNGPQTAQSTMISPITIRPAVETDVPLILRLIRGLAEYEHLLDQVAATEEGLTRGLFREPRPAAEALIAEYEGEGAGFALFFHTFSTFAGKSGLYIEDLYVLPEFRGRGLGKALVKEAARLAVERGCGRLEWSCLDWNEPSIRFYLSLGARPLTDWTMYRVAGDDLQTLAETRSGPGVQADAHA
jgi:GNAT superfamily N-acetyltransferase